MSPRMSRIGAHGGRMAAPIPRLAFHVDALNTASYPGSGSVWYDISSYGRSGTISGPTWNSGGWFNFSGNHVEWSPAGSTIPTTTEAVSMSVVFQTTTAAATQEIYGWADASDTGRVALFVDGATGKIGVETNGSGVETSSWAGASTWVHLTAVSTGTGRNDFALYVNGAAVSVTTIGTNSARSVYNGFLQLRMGAIPNHPSSAQLSGKVAIAKVWFGSLTAAQVDAEFQAIRSRFGL